MKAEKEIVKHLIMDTEVSPVRYFYFTCTNNAT